MFRAHVHVEVVKVVQEKHLDNIVIQTVIHVSVPQLWLLVVGRQTHVIAGHARVVPILHAVGRQTHVITGHASVVRVLLVASRQTHVIVGHVCVVPVLLVVGRQTRVMMARVNVVPVLLVVLPGKPAKEVPELVCVEQLQVVPGAQLHPIVTRQVVANVNAPVQ